MASTSYPLANARIAACAPTTAQQSLKRRSAYIECSRLLKGRRKSIQFGTFPALRYMVQVILSAAIYSMAYNCWALRISLPESVSAYKNLCTKRWPAGYLYNTVSVPATWVNDRAYTRGPVGARYKSVIAFALHIQLQLVDIRLPVNLRI